MIHVSFAMTRDANADRSKTETRRFWKPAHAAKFRPGVVFMGMTEESFIREGGTRYWSSRAEYIDVMGGPDLVPYVLRFEHFAKGENYYGDTRRD